VSIARREPFVTGTNATAHANLFQRANSCSREKDCLLAMKKKDVGRHGRLVRNETAEESIVYLLCLNYI